MSDCDDLAVALDSDAGRRVDVFYVGALHAVAGEARVERPVGVVADEGEVTGLDLPTRSADHDDLAVTLERHAPGTAGPERIQLLAVAGEARVERAVGVVADEGELAAGSMGSRRHDLAIVLKHHRLRRILSPKISSLLAVSGEARVERAVGVVAGDSKVVGLALPKRSANHDDLAVVLNRNTACIGEVRDRLIAIAREARVERPVGVVAADRRPPDHNDLSIGLERHCRAVPDLLRQLPVPGEARVRRSIRVVAGDGTAAAVSEISADHHDLPVGLDRSRCRPAGTEGHIGRLLAVPGERWVEVSSRSPGHRRESSGDQHASNEGSAEYEPSRPHDCHHSRSLPWVCTNLPPVRQRSHPRSGGHSERSSLASGDCWAECG